MNLFTKKILLAFIIAGAIAPFELFSVKRKFIEINDTESSEESEEETKQKKKNDKYCTICEKELSSSYALKSHITAKHNISESLKCPLYRSKTCLKKGYKHESSLREHLKAIHRVTGEKAGNYVQEALNAPNNSGNSNDTRISCPLHKEGTCRTDGYTNKVKGLAEHFMYIHKLDSKDARKLARETIQLICKTCGAEMANQKKLNAHITICTGIKTQEVSREILDTISEQTIDDTDNDFGCIPFLDPDDDNNDFSCIPFLGQDDNNDGNNDGNFDDSIFFNLQAFVN